MIHQCATHNFENFPDVAISRLPIRNTGKIREWKRCFAGNWSLTGMASPRVFIEWLKQYPCIFDLGNWILRTALTDVQKLRNRRRKAFCQGLCGRVHSLPGAQRSSESAVMNTLKETRAEGGGKLCLELTERCRDLDIHFLRGEVEFFHSQGIKIALDDFGTGNSSLSLALELPFDELKVDMSFIRDIKQKPQQSGHGAVYCGLWQEAV